MFFIRQRGCFSTLAEFQSLKSQVINHANKKFKVIGLLDQVHKLEMDSHMLKEYVELFQTINFSDFFAQQTMKVPMMNNVISALKQDEIQNDALNLLVKAYQVDEVDLLREQLMIEIYGDHEKINAKDVIQKWSYTSSYEIELLLQSHSILIKALNSRTIDFESDNFHQIVYHTYLLRKHNTYDMQCHQKFVKAFQNTSNKDIEPLDLILIAKIINAWRSSRGYSQEVEKILRKFDHYLEKISYKCSLIDRVLLLQELYNIDIPQKIPQLSNILFDAEIPKEHFAEVINALLQYEDVTLIQQKVISLYIILILDNLEDIQSFRDCVSILLGLTWSNSFHGLIFMTLFKRIEKHFEGITDIIEELPHRDLPHCCRLYQVIVSMKLHKAFDPYMSMNIPINQLHRLYTYRIEMENVVDFSQNEQDIADILYSLGSVNGWDITKIERQIKVSLFTVDFKIILTKDGKQREMLLDVLGGSLFVAKNVMGRKAQWRYHMLAAEQEVKFVNLTEWHMLSQQQKIDKIKYLLGQKEIK